MGYRPANTGYGPKPKAWCTECGDDIPVGMATRRERCGGRMVLKPLPDDECLCSFCRAERELKTLVGGASSVA